MSDFEVRNAFIETQLREIGRDIAAQLPDDWGFTLFIFTLGEGGSTFYLSNADRQDMIRALEEFIARHKGK